MRTFKVFFAALFLMLSGHVYAADLVKKESPHSVDETMAKLAAAVEGAGAKIFVKVDHAAGATSVGMKLRPTQMIMFGNPKLGTPAIQASQSAGLDLPLRVIVFEDDGGKVHLAYHAPAQLAENHGIPADAEVLKKMTGALDKLTNKAIAK